MHSPMSAQVLMRKGKRGAAVFVQAECNRTSDPQHLKDLLDHLLNPLKSIDEPDIVDWITWLVAGGKSPAEFASLVRRYDNATTCGLVWTANFVAYRCRTCGISPCMSLCADCFQKGDHTGHDFNMFRSQAGGACDCGDTSVMKESGFCDRHGPRAQIGKPSLPPDLLGVANVIMPRVILRLVQHLRDYSSQDMLDRQPDPIEEADAFITMLHEYSGTGAAMRSVMTSALINPQVYAQLTEVPGGDSEYAQFMKSIQRRYEQALESLPGPECPEEYKDFPALKETLIHCTFLEELVFWTVKFEFSQKLVCLLLNLLPDPLYKEAFTRAFVLHYARISRLLVQSSDPDTLSNRVVHVSVQLFSNEELAFKMTEQLHLLHVMVISLKDMMSKILRPSTLQDPTKNFHFVVDCSKHVMKDHCYWPLVSDLSNLLSHRRVALHFMSDDGLLEMWFAFLSMFQGMNVNQRELTTHIEFEPSSYYAAFSAELEAPASAMWALALHLRDTSTISLTRKLLKHCLSALEDWFDAIGFSRSDQVDDYQVSFHIPLHRYLAAFTGQVVRAQGLQLKDVLPPSSLLQLIMMHPLRIQASFYEILCGLWVRNGLQIRGQAMSYIQCHFGNSMVDADMYLLQICAMNLAPSFVVNTVLERFHVMDLLSLNPRTKSTFLEPDHEAPMLESCLTFLASLMSLRTNIGLNETDLDCLEMVSLLCMADRTHSQLMELLPEKSGAPQNKDFDAVLAQVADYKAPNFEASGSMQQGMYVPKPGVWEDLYDPIYVLLRAVHRKDFQSSMDRFTQYVQLSGKFPRFSSGSSSSLWPPFRLPLPVHPSYEDPRVLMQSRTFHAVLFVLLYKAVHNPQVLSEQALALTIYLIDLAVSFARDRVKPCGNEICVKEPIITQPDDRGDLQFNDWFTSDSLVENFCTLVSHVTISMPTTVSISSTDVATEVDLTSSSFSTSGDDASDQEMDMADTVADTSLLALEATQSQALVPITRAAATVTSYGVNRSPPASHSHLRALPPALSPAAQAGIISVGVASPSGASQMPGQGSRGPGSSIEIARYYAQVSNESVVSESGGPAIQYAASSTSNDNQIFIQESVISLLLKLHSKLSNAADSYALPAEERTEGAAAASASNQGERESRIGDGPFWVAKVLNKLCALDPGMRETIAATKQALWPPRPSETGESETLDEAKEREKKRKIKERQTRLLQEFANKQRQFMQQAMAEEMDTDQSGEGTAFASAEEQPPEEEVETYDCVICNQSSRSTPERPVCLVVLQQATSVLAHRRFGSDNLSLPMNDTDRFSLNKSDTYAVDTSRRIGTLQRHFDESSWLLSFNMGYEGGIYVHTCGHCLHLDCYKQYVLSLRTQRRQQSLNVDRGEYACPLCRQLANSALPIATQLISGKASQDALVPRQKGKPAEELHAIFEAESSLPTGSQLMEAVGRVMEDMTNGTFQRFRQITSQPSPASIFLFVQSIARTNLEVELIQRGGSLTNTPSTGGAVAAERSPTPGASSASWNSPGYELRFSSSPTPSTSSGTSSNVPWSLLPKRSCFLPLLHVLSIHAKILKTRPYSILWSQITGLHCREGAHSASQAPVSLCENETPVLIKDVTSILLQMILVLPLPLERQYFRCLVQNIYNVAAVQALAQITCQLNQKSRLLYQRLTTGPWSISSVLGFVVRFLGDSPLHMEDETLSNADCTAGDLRQLNLEGDVLQPFYRILLPFLRLAALLQHHLYKEELPSATVSNSECEEFTNLCGYLSICSETSFEDNVDPRSLISIWCEEFRVFLIRAPMAARSLLLQYRPWKNPRLLSLPHSYEALFQYYHNKTCARCNNVPKEPSLCLVCGTLVCLRENCCRQPQSMHDSVHEAVQHSVECGAGTAVYLAVNSSTIVVIRGKRACLWGSVYLDAFGEEDRELKRGKPLYLSKERYALLESQWLSHRFDHTNKKWVWHRDGL